MTSNCPTRDDHPEGARRGAKASVFTGTPLGPRLWCFFPFRHAIGETDVCREGPHYVVLFLASNASPS
jgi:hypothetical protein